MRNLNRSLIKPLYYEKGQARLLLFCAPLRSSGLIYFVQKLGLALHSRNINIANDMAGADGALAKTNDSLLATTSRGEKGRREITKF